MSRRRREGATWPFLFVLACLFVLSVTAPREWEKIAQRGEVGRQRANSAAALEILSPARPALVEPVRVKPSQKFAARLSPNVAAKPGW
ncbi:MAG: hypothetical protein WD278_20865, partial [Pirellulales bacterium]